MNNQGFFEMWSPRLLSVLRIVAALLFMAHGTAKLFQMPHMPMFDSLQLMSLLGFRACSRREAVAPARGTVHATGCIHTVGRHGGRVLHVSLAQELDADPERR